jgi:hypothetical protein
MNNRNVLKDNRDEILRIAASHGAQDLTFSAPYCGERLPIKVTAIS